MRTGSLALFFSVVAGCSSAPGSPDGGTPGSDAPGADAPGTDAPGTDGGTPPTDAPGADASCEACVAQTLQWGRDGGFACTRDTSSISDCLGFAHQRVAEGCDPPDLTCSDEIPACDPSRVDAEELAMLLAHPDVVAAIAAAPVLYGTDPRAFDGQVFYVVIGGARVEVGTCADASCAEIPAGVLALERALEQLTTEALGHGDCAAVFGGP